MGFFAPFGAKIVDENIVDVVVDAEFEGNMEGIILVNRIKNNFREQIKKNNAQAGAIAYDVIIDLENSYGQINKRDALCLVITMDGQNWTEEYFPYMIIDGKCIWK